MREPAGNRWLYSAALRGDLDWIVLKALEKDRARRYDTANAFAQDVQRHLNDEPVSAGPPSAVYRFRKLVRRNQLAFGAAAAMLVLLVAGIAVSTWQAVRATRAEATAGEERNNALAAQKEAEIRNAALKAQVEEAARTDRLMAQHLLDSGRGPEALAHLARAGEYTPDTSFAAEKAVVALNDWRFPLPTAVLSGHQGAVKSAIFSPDGSHIMTDEDGAVQIWDCDTGKRLITIKTHGQWLCASQFSPDGQKIVTASLDEKSLRQASIKNEVERFTTGDAKALLIALDYMVEVWDSNTGQRLLNLAGNEMGNERPGKGGVSAAIVTGQADHDSETRDMQFSPDGRHIVTVTRTGRIKIWDAETGRLLSTLKGSGLAAHFSPDGERLVAAYSPSNVYDSQSGELLTTLKRGGQLDTSAQFDSYGSRILTTASDDVSACVWDSDSGKLLHTLQTPGLRGIGHQLVCAQFCPAGGQIVTVADNRTAWVWVAHSGALVTTLQGHGDQITSAFFSPNGKHIVTSSDDMTARIWDSTNGRLLATLQGHAGKVTGARFSPDGRRIVTASDDKTARVWDARTDNLQTTLQSAGMVGKAQFSPDGRCIVTVSHTEAQVWESSGGRLLTTLAGHEKQIQSARFSPDNQRIVTASEDGTARIWEGATDQLLAAVQKQEVDEFLSAAQRARPLAVLSGHAGTVWSAAFSPDNSRVVTASEDGTARVWDSASGEVVTTLQGQGRSVGSANFSPDGRRIITIAGGDSTVQVWEMNSGAVALSLTGHEQQVNSAQFSADGRRIITGSDDRTVKIWDSATGELLATLRGHENKVTSAQFSSDGQRIITASADNTSRIWDASTGATIAFLNGKAVAVSRAQFSPDGMRAVTEGDGTPRVWELLGTTEPPPPWFADFLRLIAQRRFDKNGELVLMPAGEFVVLRMRLEGIAAAERSRYAAIARWFLSPAGKYSDAEK